MVHIDNTQKGKATQSASELVVQFTSYYHFLEEFEMALN